MLPLLVSEARFFNVLERVGVAERERDDDICEAERCSAAPGVVLVGVGVMVAEVEVFAGTGAGAAVFADGPSSTTEPR